MPLQQQVDHYFESSTFYWDQLYSESGLLGTIYQHRREVSVRWIKELYPTDGTSVVDIGCGAGATAVPLAQMGYRVLALDRVQSMLETLSANARRAGVSSRIRTATADACHLHLADSSCDVIVALGLLPWVASPAAAVAEMARVIRPGGHVIISADNPWRLNFVLDPVENPLCVPIRRAIARQLRRTGILKPKDGVDVIMHTAPALRRLLTLHGLRPIECQGIGFGPFTVFRQPMLPESLGLAVNACLQRRSDRNSRLLCYTGVHNLVLAEKTQLKA
jgi:2-polyprenyl-3-methyl-5-hydroxy-6-metoxy-1,4-benzoquinol methylase